MAEPPLYLFDIHNDSNVDAKEPRTKLKSLHHIIAVERRLTAFGDAVRMFPEIVEMLDEENDKCGPISVFAPSNTAFQKHKHARRGKDEGDYVNNESASNSTVNLPPAFDQGNLEQMVNAHLYIGKAWRFDDLEREGAPCTSPPTSQQPEQSHRQDGLVLKMRNGNQVAVFKNGQHQVWLGRSKIDESGKDLVGFNGVIQIVDDFISWWE